MKRFFGVAAAVVAFGFGAAACSKAHNAGNDRMESGGSRIVAAGATSVRQ